MKKWILILICIFLNDFALSKDMNKPENLFKKPELCELMKLTQIPCSQSEEEIIRLTQKHWLRPAGKERWEIEDLYKDKKSEFLPLLKKLAYVDTISPKNNKYDYAIVMGGLSSRMRKRLGFLAKQWEQGLRFKHIFFLAGERERNPVLESEAVLIQKNPYLNYPEKFKVPFLPKTEKDIAELIYNHSVLPKELRKVPISFINVPMKKNKDGKLLRPNTDDTVEFLFAKYSLPKNSSILSFSDQPFILYQDAVLKQAVSKRGHFKIETVGFAADENDSIAVYLDSIARTLYMFKSSVP